MHIEIDEIAKAFGATTALHPVSLAIPSGALVALMIRCPGCSSSISRATCSATRRSR